MDLYGYMSQDDREYAVAEAVINNKFFHLNQQFDQVMMEHQLALNDIEMKVLVEEGTDEDLDFLIEAKQAETTKKSKGLIGGIFSAILTILKKIKEFLFGKTEKVDSTPESKLPKQIKLKCNPDEEMKKGDEILKALNDFAHNPKAKKGAIRTFLGGVAASAGGFILYRAAIKPAIKSWKGWVNKKQKDVEELNDAVENNPDLTPEQIAEIKEGTNALQSCFNLILNAIHGVHIGEGEEGGDTNANEPTPADGKEGQEEKKPENKEENKPEDKADNKPSEEGDKEPANLSKSNSDVINDLRKQLAVVKEAIRKLEKKAGRAGRREKLAFIHKSQKKDYERIKAIPPDERSAADAEKYQEYLDKGFMKEEISGTKSEQMNKLLEDLRKAEADIQKKLSTHSEGEIKSNSKSNTRDISELLADAKSFTEAADQLYEEYARYLPDTIATVDDWINEFL